MPIVLRSAIYTATLAPSLSRYGKQAIHRRRSPSARANKRLSESQFARHLPPVVMRRICLQLVEALQLVSVDSVNLACDPMSLSGPVQAVGYVVRTGHKQRERTARAPGTHQLGATLARLRRCHPAVVRLAFLQGAIDKYVTGIHGASGKHCNERGGVRCYDMGA